MSTAGWQTIECLTRPRSLAENHTVEIMGKRKTGRTCPGMAAGPPDTHAVPLRPPRRRPESETPRSRILSAFRLKPAKLCQLAGRISGRIHASRHGISPCVKMSPPYSGSLPRRLLPLQWHRASCLQPSDAPCCAPPTLRCHGKRKPRFREQQLCCSCAASGPRPSGGAPAPT